METPPPTTTAENQVAAEAMALLDAKEASRLPPRRLLIALMIIVPILVIVLIVSGMFLTASKPLTASIHTGSVRQTAERAVDQVSDPTNFVPLKEGEELIVDLGSTKPISQVNIWSDAATPGKRTDNVIVKIGKKADLTDGQVVYSGSLIGGSSPTTISFPATSAQYVSVQAGSGSGGTNVNEVSVSNVPAPAVTLTLTPTLTPQPSGAPTLAPATPTTTPEAATPIPTATSSLNPPTPTPVSINLTVTSNSTMSASFTNLGKIVNSIYSTDDYGQVEATKYVQVHLPQPMSIYKIQVHPQALPNRIVKTMKVEVSSEANFASASTIFLGDALANVNGVIIAPNPPVTARYVRVTANGTLIDQTLDPITRYTEVAIWAN